MHEATQVLRKEHDAILRMLEATQQVAGQLEQGYAVKPEVLTGLLEFFQLFADRCHHGREEELLFPLLEKRGIPRAGGPIGVMLHEPGLGRDLVQEMSAAADAYRAGDSSAGARWAVAARRYTALLEQHIAKENNVLFVLAENVLTEGEQRELAEAFDRVETEKMGAGTHERLHRQMESLLAEIAASAPTR